MRPIAPFIHLCGMGAALGVDLARPLAGSLRSRAGLTAENLFLRKQLALYRERQVQPRGVSVRIRLGLVLLARCFAWREALTIVQPATLLRWHREVFRLLWRWAWIALTPDRCNSLGMDESSRSRKWEDYVITMSG